MVAVEQAYLQGLRFQEHYRERIKSPRNFRLNYHKIGYRWIFDISQVLEIPIQKSGDKLRIKIPDENRLKVEATEYVLPNNLQLRISRNFGNSLDPYFHICVSESNPQSYVRPETYIRYTTSQAVKIKVNARKKQLQITHADGARNAINVVSGVVIKLRPRASIRTTHMISESSIFQQLASVVRNLHR